jgi:hypothetical protein
MKKTAFLVFCILLVAVNTFAQDNVQRESLKGLSAVPVEVTATDGTKATQWRLQEFVELRLRTAGIKVPEKNAPLYGEGSAKLWILVVSDKSGTLSAVEFKLKQSVRLERRPSVVMWLPTWESRVWGGEDQSTEDVIKKILNGFLDSFINDYLAVNPK